MSQYVYYTDPVTGLRVRDGARDENLDGIPEYVIDKELTVTGFNGTKSTDNGITGDWVLIGGSG